MSTKIDRSSPATPSVPTAPAEPVKPAEAPKPAGKADVETGIVQDVVERGESWISAGKALFGVVEKKVTDVVVDKAADVALGVGSGVASAKRSVAELQADASRALDKVKPALVEAAHVEPLSIGKTLLHDLATKGVDGVLKEQFKQISPTIADPAKVAQTLSRAGEIFEQRLSGVSQELRQDAVGVLIDIKNNTAPYLTAEDLKLPFTEPRRVLAEVGLMADECVAGARSAVIKGATELGLGVAHAINTTEVGHLATAAVETAEGMFSGRLFAEFVGIEGVRPFALINYPVVKLLDSVKGSMELAKKIDANPDAIRAFSDALCPKATEGAILALKDNDSMFLSLGGKVAVSAAFGASLGGQVGLKVTRQPGEPPVFIAEISQDKQMSAGGNLKLVKGEAGRVETEKITVELKGEQAVKDFVGVLYGKGLDVLDDPAALNHIAEKVTREESAGGSLGIKADVPSVLSAEMGGNFIVSRGETTDKAGEPVSSLYKLSGAGSLGAGVNTTGEIKLRLPQARGEQGAALRRALVENYTQTPGLGTLARNIPPAALERLVEINGLRTDISLKTQTQFELAVELPAKTEDLGKASSLTLTTTITNELGDTALESKLDIIVKNPAALFKMFAELPPEQLAARMADGSITHEQLAQRATERGVKIEDVLTVKLSSTERVSRATGADISIEDNNIKAEQGVIQNTLLGEHVFIGSEPAAKPDASRDQSLSKRTISDLVSYIKG
jgi:hypothetical protein